MYTKIFLPFFFHFFLFQLKSLRAQKSKKPEESNAGFENFMDGTTFANKLKLEPSPANSQQIDDKSYEYIVQQNEFANGQYTNGVSSDTSSDGHKSENDFEYVEEECDESGESDDSDEIDEIDDKSEESEDTDDTTSESDNSSNDEDSDSSENDDIADLVNQQFEDTPVRPIIVSAQTCLDDSEPTEKDVKFFIDKSRSTAIAEYDGTEYRIGFLDLTAEEKRCMEMISQSEIYLIVKSNHIMIRDNRFNIKRITEREVPPNTEQPFDSMYEKLNLGRVQFGTEPFFAKYQNEIYLVGEQLYHEYSELLKRTKKCSGTAIRIGNDRLVIDYPMQTLDINESIPFQNQNEICVISGSFDMYKFHDEYPLTSYQRFMICSNPWSLLEIEPELLHSSIYDDCAEIYAETDFPFSDSTKVEKIANPAKITKQARKNEPRYLEEE